MSCYYDNIIKAPRQNFLPHTHTAYTKKPLIKKAKINQSNDSKEETKGWYESQLLDS